ncbi:MAG: DNA alkylation repair protein [Bacteroidetes bacterium]|nr:DNA alkylation repair protein [Bacteroidota bacterium]
MISPEKNFKQTETYCKANADPAIVLKYSKYFKEGYDAWGVSSELVNRRADEIFVLQGITIAEIYEICLLLVKSPKYEMTSIAGLLLKKLKKQWNSETFVTLENIFKTGINNWAHTDWICGEIIPDMIKMNLIGMESLKPWRTAPNRFQRRAAVVGLIKPMKKSADFKPYFDFIDPMMLDEERVVHQGLGWFLREAWKKQPEPTEKFLLKWKDSAARLIFQYATEKMSPEQKARFRKGKSK